MGSIFHHVCYSVSQSEESAEHQTVLLDTDKEQFQVYMSCKGCLQFAVGQNIGPSIISGSHMSRSHVYSAIYEGLYIPICGNFQGILIIDYTLNQIRFQNDFHCVM